jgi:hypothetical protein
MPRSNYYILNISRTSGEGATFPLASNSFPVSAAATRVISEHFINHGLIVPELLSMGSIELGGGCSVAAVSEGGFSSFCTS